MIFEKANYHCLQTCLSKAFPCFAFKAPRVKPLARIPPIPPQRRAPCPAFLSGAWGYFLCVWCFLGWCFNRRNRRRAGAGRPEARRAGGKLRTTGGSSAPAEKPRRGGRGEPFSWLSLYSNAAEEADFQMNIFIIDNSDDKKWRAACPCPASRGSRAPLRPQRWDALGCAERTAGLPRQRSPPAQALRLVIIIIIFMIFIIYDFYHLRFLPLQPPLASFNPLCPHLHPLGHARGWEKPFPRVGYSMPSSRFSPFPSPLSPRPRPAPSARSALAAAAAASAGWGGQLPTPPALDDQFPATAANLR